MATNNTNTGNGAQAQKKAPKKMPGLRVTSQREGFRRAGFSFGRTPTDLVLADLSEKRIKALKSEPMLSVQEVSIDTDGVGGDEASQG